VYAIDYSIRRAIERVEAGWSSGKGCVGADLSFVGRILAASLLLHVTNAVSEIRKPCIG